MRRRSLQVLATLNRLVDPFGSLIISEQEFKDIRVEGRYPRCAAWMVWDYEDSEALPPRDDYLDAPRSRASSPVDRDTALPPIDVKTPDLKKIGDEVLLSRLPELGPEDLDQWSYSTKDPTNANDD